MGDDPKPETSHGKNSRPFSVVLTTTTTLAVRGVASIRYLRGPRNSLKGEDDTRPLSLHPTLCSVVIAVQAQPCTLHLFRGHRLCRVIRFDSPIADVSGSPSSDPLLGVLCIVACSDGTIYELPTEVIEGQAVSGGESAKSGACAAQRQVSIKSSLDIFDDLAPTMAPLPCPSSQQVRGDENRSDGDRGEEHGCSLGGLVRSAGDAWVLMSHLGARRVATCPGCVAVVTGILDRTASYHIVADKSVRPIRRLATVDGVDGAAPTTSLVVWMKQGEGDEANIGSGDVAVPGDVFRAFFGSEIALSGTPFPRQSGPTAVGSSEAGCNDSQVSRVPAVVLVGDDAGVVRWAPISCVEVPGGTLVDLKQSIVEILPQLDSNAKTIGLVIVGVGGAVVTLTGVASGPSRERSTPASNTDGRGGGQAATIEPERHPGVVRLHQAQYKLPFPVAAVCSTPGFLIHSHAGALFATALPEGNVDWGVDVGEMLVARGESVGFSPRSKRKRDRSVDSQPVKANRSLEGLMVRSIRLPLPCEAVDIAAVQVLLNGEEVAPNGVPPGKSPVTVVFTLSARGRLTAFLSPTSVEELEGWSLDTGKGGIRVGGSAVIERKVRCQLERLSSVGQKGAALSAESAARDQEIRVLRGASRLIPRVVTDLSKRPFIDSEKAPDEDPQDAALGHSVSMEPDYEAGLAGVEHASARDVKQEETLRVRLRVRVRAHDVGRSRWLPEPGEEGYGRWFVTNQVVSGGGLGSEARVDDYAWSVSSPLSIGLLRQGREWLSSTSLSLPSAHPVIVTTWLQLRFDKRGDLDSSHRSNLSTRGGLLSRAGACAQPSEPAEGVCVKLGTTQFDILDWGVRLASVPPTDSSIRGSAQGRGLCIGGSDTVISNFLEDSMLGQTETSNASASEEQLTKSSRHQLKPLARCSIFVTHPCGEARVLLEKLMGPSSATHSPRSSKSSASVSGLRDGVMAEAAIRVGGQVAVFRATDSDASVSGGVSACDGGSDAGIEVAVICSHETMLPLIRHAVLRRVRLIKTGQIADSGDCVAGEIPAVRPRERLSTRAQAAERLSRELHALRQACMEAGDRARGLGVTRMREGPQRASTLDARAIMGKLGEAYKSLRQQQEGGAVV